MGKFTRTIDWHHVILLLVLGIFGIGVLLTVDTGIAGQQALFFLVGILLMVGFSLIDPFIYIWFSPFGYIASILFLLTSFLGPSIRGATRWILVFGTQLQPSELIKPFMLLGFAYFITKYPPRTLKNIVIQIGVFFIPFFLIFRQPDLGTGLVYTSFWLSMMIAGGLPLWVFGAGVGGFAALLPLLWHTLAAYQKSRILTFLSPTLDPGGAGYNAIQSMITVGSGQWWGKGLGLGTQSHLRFLPEYHTDFIFATLVEELGFIGGFLLLVLYGMLLWRIIRPFMRQEIDDMYIFVYSIGLCTMLLSQVAINTGMNMGILPITGITLPLISYGGSSLLSICSAFGIGMALGGSAKKTRHIANDWVN